MYKHLIYRGFDIQETEQSWIISMNSDGETSYKNYPATELLKTDFKTEEDVYNQINKIKKELKNDLTITIWLYENYSQCAGQSFYLVY